MVEPNKYGITQRTEENKTKISTPVVEGILRYRKLLIILAHIVSFAVSLLLSFLITKNMRLSRAWVFYQYPAMLLLSLPIKLVIFALFRQYKCWWRYVGISDLMGITKASLASTAVIVVLWFGILQGDTLRRIQTFQSLTEVGQGVIMLDLFTTIMLLGGLRMMIRMYHEEFLAEMGTTMKRFLIIGAADAGEALLREITRMKVEQYDVVGFVDDDPAKKGMNIHGVSVL